MLAVSIPLRSDILFLVEAAEAQIQIAHCA